MAALRSLLAGYPSYALPYPGPGTALSRTEAKANLAWLLTQRATRVRACVGLLNRCGIDGAAMADDDSIPFLAALWQWTDATWSPLRPRRPPSFADWLAEAPRTAPALFALLMDLGLLLGDLVLRQRPAWHWALDLDPDHAPGAEAEELGAWQRPVLFRPPDPPVRAAMLDLQGNVAALFLYGAGASAAVLQRELTQTLSDAITGRAEAIWRRG